MEHTGIDGMIVRNLIAACLLSSLIAVPHVSRAALNVFACEPEWAALAEEIGGSKVKVTSATRPMQDPHYVEARPSLISKMRRADLLVCTGADLEEGWLPVLLRKGSNPRVQAGQPGHLMVADYIQLKEIPIKLDRSEGHMHAAGNPHFQTDPRNMLPAARALAERLVTLDADNKQVYLDHLSSFEQRWKAALRNWNERAAPLRNQPVVVYHRSWIYLQDWLGLDEVAALEPKPGVPPGSRYLADVLARTQDVSDLLIIHSQYQESKAIGWFSDKTGAPVVVLPTTIGGTPGADSLFSWFDAIINLLLEAQAKV